MYFPFFFSRLVSINYFSVLFQIFNFKELLQKVTEGRFSLISVKNYLMVIMASNYVDKYGQIPFHIGTDERFIQVCFGWGVR